jgi:multiple sugar transport system ATP-binding protein
VELKRLHERLETTAIYVTHDQVEAMTLGSRVVVMRDGWVQQVGEPLEIYSRPANKFVAGFIGSPAMNFVPVNISEANGTVYAEASGIRVKVPADKGAALKAYKGQTVVIGIRPEDLRVGSGADSSDLAFDAVVEVVEPLGSEILLNVTVAGQQVVSRVEPSVKARPHDKIRMAFVPERIHFFDAKNESVIK